MPELINFKQYWDKRGVLVPIEGERDIPFAIKRRWHIRNVPEGETRGNHAHAASQQVIIALVGSFKVTWVGKTESSFLLDSDNVGIYIEPGVWVSLSDFSPDAVCEVFSDCYFDEEDLIA